MIQFEGKTWIAAHGFAIYDAVKNETKRKNERTFIEDLAAVAEGRVEPYSLIRAAGSVPILIEILDSAPVDQDIDDYDAVVDAPLQLASGVLKIEGDIDSFGFHLDPGDYRIRVAYANNGTSRDDYPDGADHVRLALWRAPAAALSVRKEFSGIEDPTRDGTGYRVAKQWRRPESDLYAYLEGPSISHRCLAIVGMAQLGKVEELSKYIENNGQHYPTLPSIYLSALGLAGEKALPLIEEADIRDDDDRLRIVQTLRYIGGDKAKEIAKRLVEDLDGSSTTISLTLDSVEDIAGDGEEE